MKNYLVQFKKQDIDKDIKNIEKRYLKLIFHYMLTRCNLNKTWGRKEKNRRKIMAKVLLFFKHFLRLHKGSSLYWDT